uniref:Glycine-rich cell wall structural protein n=1 Tax=Steinernema glaseri TaxID=37863 RepID=A0A1I8A846_9BILA
MRWTLLPLLVLLGLSSAFGKIGEGVVSSVIGGGVAPEAEDGAALGEGVSLDDGGIGHGVRVARQIGAGVGFGGNGGIGSGVQPGWGGARGPIGSGVQPAHPIQWNNGGIGSGVQPAHPAQWNGGGFGNGPQPARPVQWNGGGRMGGNFNQGGQFGGNAGVRGGQFGANGGLRGSGSIQGGNQWGGRGQAWGRPTANNWYGGRGGFGLNRWG